ncbi:hypothetical protein Godav_021196 [Gossypium davidsonii]|uniref:Uncharacterized protein n=2 Tax=Gossypium TaxID=3633 RepID=A0A7J9BH68_GOSGO|nr:hypothetical protein [Gossypium davidsonii]MBA0735491.1 hypothetical protein [Gossypium gossypioides]
MRDLEFITKTFIKFTTSR